MRDMKPVLILAAAALMTMGSAVAQDGPQREPREMTTEERDAAREARRARWETMSDEERAAFREKREQRMAERRAERRERFENISPEERQAMRERKRERSARRHEQRRHGKRGDSSADPGPEDE